MTDQERLDTDEPEDGDPQDEDAVIHPDAEPDEGAGDAGDDIVDPEEEA